MSGGPGDDTCWERARERRVLDTGLIREPLSAAPLQQALEPGTGGGVTQPAGAMQREDAYGVLVADEGSGDGKRVSVFAEREILLRIIERSGRPVTLPMGEGA